MGSFSFVAELDLNLFVSGMVHGSHYLYKDDLMSLNSYGTITEIPNSLCANEISYLMMWERWYLKLTTHSDRKYIKYTLQGLKGGLHISFNPSQCLISATSTLHVHDTSTASGYVSREVALNRT